MKTNKMKELKDLKEMIIAVANEFCKTKIHKKDTLENIDEMFNLIDELLLDITDDKIYELKLSMNMLQTFHLHTFDTKKFIEVIFEIDNEKLNNIFEKLT